MNTSALHGHSTHLRAGAAALGLTVAALLAGGVAAAPARADSAGCDNAHDVCIYATGVAGGDVTISASALNTDFDGTVTLTAPGGFSTTSSEQTFYATDPATGLPYDTWSFTFTGAWTGEYCVQGYSSANANMGMACEQVH